MSFFQKRPYVVVVLNLEQFLVRATQVLLYKVLDATRTQPLFALCVTSRQVGSFYIQDREGEGKGARRDCSGD